MQVCVGVEYGFVTVYMCVSVSVQKIVSKKVLKS